MDFDSPRSENPLEDWILRQEQNGFKPWQHLHWAPPELSGGQHNRKVEGVIILRRGREYSVWVEAQPPYTHASIAGWFPLRKTMRDLGYPVPFWRWQWSPSAESL